MITFYDNLNDTLRASGGAIPRTVTRFF